MESGKSETQSNRHSEREIDSPRDLSGGLEKMRNICLADCRGLVN